MARQPTDQMSEAVVTALSSTTCAGGQGGRHEAGMAEAEQ